MYYTIIFTEVKYNYPDLEINGSFIETDKYILTFEGKHATSRKIRKFRL